jgi:hypothetical protein
LDPTLLKALIGSGIFVGASAIVVALLKFPTELWAAKSAARKVKLDIEEAERKEQAARRQEDRTDLETCRKRCDQLQEQLDKAREDRDKERVRAREAENLLSMRLFQCERIGKPCQPSLPLPLQDTKEGA